MDADSFIVYIKTDDIYKDIAQDFETSYDTSKIMKVFLALRAKTSSYLIDNVVN